MQRESKGAVGLSALGVPLGNPRWKPKSVLRTCNYWEILRGQIVLDQPDCLRWRNVETGRAMTLVRLGGHLSQRSHVEAGEVWGGALVRVENWLKWLRMLEVLL